MRKKPALPGEEDPAQREKAVPGPRSRPQPFYNLQLWSNNAKMILRYWALQGSDDDDNPPFP